MDENASCTVLGHDCTVVLVILNEPAVVANLKEGSEILDGQNPMEWLCE